MANVRMIGVSAAADGALWGVDSAGFVYMQREPNEWKRNPSAKQVKEIAVGSKDHVCCRTSDGAIFQLEGTDWDGSWVRDDSARDVQSISVGADGAVWVANTQGKVFMRADGRWEQNPYARDAKEVSVGDTDNVWYRDGSGKVHKLINNDWESKWRTDIQASHVQFISAASDGTVWVGSADPADKDRLFRRTGTNKWHMDETGKAIQGSVGATNKVFVVNDKGTIHHLQGSAWSVVRGPDLASLKMHRVKKNETLGAIVKNTYELSGSPLTAKIKEVAGYNGIADPDQIDTGQEIVLP